jgi:hypothetical protein
MSKKKNALVPFDANALPSTELATDDQLTELTKGVDYLQRLQLVTKGKYVDTGKISPGRYGVPQPGGEEIDDLGAEIDILPLCVRPKALDMRDKEAIVAVYDMDNPAFQEIKKLSATSDSGCMWGPSFLVLERSTGQFFEFFMGNKSARAESGNLIKFLAVSPEKAERTGTEAHGPLPCTLKARYATSGSWGWHVPVVSKCSEPFTNAPDIEAIREEMEKFIAVKDNGVQNVTEEEAKATKRRAR